MSKASVVSENKKWQQQDDARTLAQAEQIKADKARLKGAQTAAKSMVAEQNKQTQALQKVAGKSTAKSTPSKPKGKGK